MNDMKYKIQMNHIRRLEERSKELSEMLVQERIWRKEAYEYYKEKIYSKLWFFWAAYLRVFN